MFVKERHAFSGCVYFFARPLSRHALLRPSVVYAIPGLFVQHPTPLDSPNPSECQNRDQTGPNFKALAFKRAAQSVQDYPLIISSGRDAETLKWVVSTSIYN